MTAEDPSGIGESKVERELRAEGLGQDGWRRLHPLSPLLRGGLFVLVLFGIVVANLRDRIIGLFVSDEFTEGSQDIGDLLGYLAAQGLLLLFFVLLAATILLTVFFSWLAWRFRSFRITAEAVEERSGILFRQHRRAPLERIQSVNLQRPLLARVLGLTEISVQTAGTGGKVSLRYLSHAHAKEVREQILRVRAIVREDARQGSAEGAGSAEGGPLGEPRPGAAAPIFPNAKPGSIPAALDRRAVDFVDFDIDVEAEQTGSLVRVPVGRLLGSIVLSWDLLIPLTIVVAGLVVGVVWHPGAFAIVVPGGIAMIGIGFGQFNRGFGFTLSRSADGIRVGAGLTATNTETIPLRRIHAIEARQPLGWRPFGWWRVRITTAGHSVSQGGQNRMQNFVLPVGLEADVLRVFETLQFATAEAAHDDPAEATDGDAAEAAHSTAALRDALLGSGRGYQGAGPRSAWVLWFGRARAGIVFDRAAEQPPAAQAVAGPVPESLRIRRGALTRSLSIMPIVRAQSVQLRRPMVHRMLGLASIQAHTVLGPIRMEMRGLELQRARDIFDTLAETVVLVQSSDSGPDPEADEHGR